MKIAYVVDQIVLCGGLIVPFEHCKELRKRGYEAFIVARGRNQQLQEAYPDVPVFDFRELESFTDEDVIVSVWWMQVPELHYKGRKIQFVQGQDLKAYIGDDLKKKCLEIRQREDWEIMAVSKYAGEWAEKDFFTVPNAINDRFFENHNLEKDIDILIEGNNEENKGIDRSIEIAKGIGGKIAWLGRETKPIEGVECFTNPLQSEIPKIYQRAKRFLKLSESEGFCLPILEAMASKCLVVTHDMGGNDWCKYGENCLLVDNFKDLNIDKSIVEAGYQTSLKYTWENSINILENHLKKVSNLKPVL